MRPSRLRAVRTQKIGKRRFLKDGAILVGVGFLFSLFHVWTRVQVIETGYAIRELTEKREELRGENHTLKVEVASLRSPLRLDKVSKMLGLESPPEKQVTLISVKNP